MTRFLLILSIVSTIFVGCTNPTSAQNNLDASKFQEGFSKENTIILDVRTKDEFNEGHIENAQNIDYYSDNFETEVNKLDKSKTVYVYCRSGGRSGKAMNILVKNGFTVFNLNGGMMAWNSAKLPSAK